MIQFHTLVASDLDGTLLPEGQTELPCAVFDEIRRLHDCGGGDAVQIAVRQKPLRQRAEGDDALARRSSG